MGPFHSQGRGESRIGRAVQLECVAQHLPHGRRARAEREAVDRLIAHHFEEMDRQDLARLAASSLEREAHPAVLARQHALEDDFARTGIEGQRLVAADDLHSRPAQTALLLALAVAVVPAHRQLRPRIDRLLFAERYAVEQGIEELIGELPGCATTEELARRVGTTLSGLMRPRHCFLYAHREPAYLPVFAESVETDEPPPSYEERSPAVAALRRRPSPRAVADCV